MGEDIDDRKPQHERLTEQARLLDLTTDAIIVRDPTDRVVYWNLAAEEMYGYTQHQAMGRVTHDLLQTQFPAPLKEILEHLHRHGRWSGELVHTRADGRRITAFSRWVLDCDQSGNPTSVVETNHDITDRKHSEEQLARSEERYRSLVSVITDVPWTTDANGGFVTPQPAWTAYTGQSWEELRGFGWAAALHPDDREQVKRTWEGACAERTPYESRGRLWHAPSQQYRYFIARATPILNPDNSVREWVGACTDVHERETAENRLTMLARISELIGTLDDPGELLFGVSRAVGEHLSVRRCFFGEIDLANDCGTVRRDYCRGVASVAGIYRLSEYSSLTTLDMQAGKTVVNRDSRSDPRTATSYQGTYERNAERAYVAVPLLRDRRWVATLWVSDDVPRQWREQEVALLETVAERTWTAVEKRRIAAALRESDARFRTVINQATTGVFQADATGRMTLVNQRWCEMLGYAEAELLQLTLAEVTDPETITPTLEALRRLADGGPDIVLEKRYRRKDGSMFWASSSVNAIRDPRGEYQGLVAVVLDITERKQAEESVFYQKRLLEALTESVVDGILIVSPEGRMVHFNQRFLDIWNFPRNIIQSRSDEAALRWAAEQTADPRAFLERVTAVYARPEEQVREEMLMKDGRVYERCGSPIQSGTDRLGWVWTFRDITDRKRAEAALRSAERMEAVGRLAGGVAHETNNQMTVVLGCASFALRAPDLPRETREELLNIQKAAERTAAITAQLLAFSRRQILRPEPLDLNAVLESFAPILRRTLGEASELTLNLSPRLGPIVADRGQIEQVLVNLTLNARDAMPDGGTLTIETEPTALARPELTSYAEELLAPGRYGVLTVRDTGHGMAPDTLVRIFEPFFTTKPLGRGTGLGLSTVYGIARQLGGDIRVRSAPGAGTAFRVYLPLAESPMASGGAPAPSLSAGAAGTLLVVEDEPLVRALAVRALRAEGFEVLEAEHGQAALELLDRQGGTVQAVVSDVAMPVMGGRELAERLARSHPTVPVLLVSGYAADELVRRGMLADDGVPLLRKPFGPEALVERVRALVSPVRSVVQ